MVSNCPKSSELQGVPIRCEIGPRDLDASQAVFVRRDTGDKLTVAMKEIVSRAQQVLVNIHDYLYTT